MKQQVTEEDKAPDTDKPEHNDSAEDDSTPGAEQEVPYGRRNDPDAALEERKQKLEAELEAYAQAGAFSPGLVKASKWVSRALYFIMAGVVVFLIFSGWGKHSDEDFNRVSDAYEQWKKEAEDTKAAKKEIESRLVEAELRAAELKLQLQSELHGKPAANRAQTRARNLIDRAWGELAYAAHWRKKLETAEPDAHGIAPVDGAKAMIEQAANATAAQRFELLNEAADFGAEGVFQAATTGLASQNLEVVKLSAKLLGWLETEEATGALANAVKASSNPEKRRSLLFALETVSPGTAAKQGEFFEAEAWVGVALKSFSGALGELVDAYKKAPEENRLELIAMLAEAGGTVESELFRSVALSTRPKSERIIAIRWLGERGDEAGKKVLKSLGEGEGVLAQEATQALKETEN